MEGDAEGEASADVTLTQGSLHGHRSLQLVLAQPYHPQLRARDFPTPSLQSDQTAEGNTPQRCHLEHSERKAQPLELKSVHLKEQLCNCLCRALQNTWEQKQREENNSFSL